MPCDGKNPNCDRRRELLAQLKCLISSMDRKKPCEWDEQSCPPIVCCPTKPSSCIPFYCGPVKSCKSFDFRASIMYRCECIKRNGLQDRCMMWDCMGRPECMSKLYPVCEPGRDALLKLTNLDDIEVALRKFYYIDQARETALSAYCKLIYDKACQREALSCNRDNSQNVKTLCTPAIFSARNDTSIKNDNNSWYNLALCNDPSYRVYVPSPLCSNYILQSYGVRCLSPYLSCIPCYPAI